MERLEFGTAVGKAKVFGTLVGIGGAMLFTFYKGFSIDFLKSNINLLPGTSTGHVALLPSDHHVLGACLALISCFSYSIWIIIQVSNLWIYVRVLCCAERSGQFRIRGYEKKNIYTHRLMKRFVVFGTQNVHYRQRWVKHFHAITRAQVWWAWWPSSNPLSMHYAWRGIGHNGSSGGTLGYGQLHIRYISTFVLWHILWRYNICYQIS